MTRTAPKVVLPLFLVAPDQLRIFEPAVIIEAERMFEELSLCLKQHKGFAGFRINEALLNELDWFCAPPSSVMTWPRDGDAMICA